MDKYESLLEMAQNNDLTVYENVQFNQDINGLIVNNTIALSSKLKKSSEKKCVLAEEIAHYLVNTGDIVGLDMAENCYQENKAHRYAVDMVLSLQKLIDTIIDLQEEATIANVAERLDVTEGFLEKSLEFYSQRFGDVLEYKGYIVTFVPQVHVHEIDKYLNCG